MRDIVALRLAAMRAMHFHLAELGSKRELLFARQKLARKNNDVMREKRLPDCVLQLG
jgi:CII-binding regulator of phage lambda lysogenization HflD